MENNMFIKSMDHSFTRHQNTNESKRKIKKKNVLNRRTMHNQEENVKHEEEVKEKEE